MQYSGLHHIHAVRTRCIRLKYLRAICVHLRLECFPFAFIRVHFAVTIPGTMADSGSLTADEVIRMLNLEAHPEGGYYRETFRDSTRVAERSASTAIYFL
ncbi:MAG TPA: cupin domain-containing protein, partial [Chthoniobacterales bacterium]|nr:cupin domain-containing protein [Chthoniobacterales bacterium]